MESENEVRQVFFVQLSSSDMSSLPSKRINIYYSPSLDTPGKILTQWCGTFYCQLRVLWKVDGIPTSSGKFLKDEVQQSELVYEHCVKIFLI